MSDSTTTITLRIRRFDPAIHIDPYWETFSVPVSSSDRVLDALHYVKWNLDGSLSFRRSCAHGICGSDAMMINGRNALACVTSLSDLGDSVTIEPLRGLAVQKDLIVDMEPFFAHLRAIRPYLIANDDSKTSDADDGRERRQLPDDRARIDLSTRCILCAACTTSCPVAWSNERYVGPAALVNAHRFLFDTRDEAFRQRLHELATLTTALGCRTAQNCTNACPRDIPVTEIITEIKRAIAKGRR